MTITSGCSNFRECSKVKRTKKKIAIVLEMPYKRRKNLKTFNFAIYMTFNLYNRFEYKI